jgi:hypothetical protein
MAGNDFLGRGWAFALPRAPLPDEPSGLLGVNVVPSQEEKPAQPVQPIAEASGEEKIRQSIWLILSTSPGERIGRPDFGCGIHDMVFATRSSSTLGEVRRAVTQALQRWEPRIEVLEVNARPHPEDAYGLLIELQYAVRATNSRHNLVYPFYLSP